MEAGFRILGPIEVDVARWRDGPVPRGRTLSFLALLLVHRGADRLTSTAPSTSSGRVRARSTRARRSTSSRRGCAAALGRRRWSQSAGGGYAPAARAGRAGRRAVRGPSRTRAARSSRAGDPRRGRGDAPGGARALARPGAGGRRRRALRPAGDRAARGPAARLPRRSPRGRPGLRTPRRARRRARGARAASIPLRERLRGPADARALSRRAVRRTHSTSYREAYDALVERAGHRAFAAAACAADRDPSPRGARAGHAARRRPAACVPGRRRAAPRDVRLRPCDRLRRARRRRRRVAPRHAGAGTTKRLARSSPHHGGTVAELRNDAVLAVFGTAVAHEDDPQRALRATAELTDRTERLPFGVRACCGVSTGEVVAAADGSRCDAGDRRCGRCRGAARPGGCARRDPNGRADLAACASRRAASGAPRRGPPARGPSTSGRRRSRAGSDRPLLGREPELDRLRATFARVVATRNAGAADDPRRAQASARPVSPRA